MSLHCAPIFYGDCYNGFNWLVRVPVQDIIDIKSDDALRDNINDVMSCHVMSCHVLNLVLIVSTLLLMSKMSFQSRNFSVDKFASKKECLLNLPGYLFF